MNSLVKKTIIYSMVGVMQFGMFATVAEASALNNNGSEQVVELRGDHRGHDHDRRRYQNDRRRHYEERRRIEIERHEREMRRRPYESRRHWHERQRHERDRHDRELRAIGAFLLGFAFGSSRD